MVRLDDVCLAGFGTCRFDDVGVNRSLCQPFDALQPLCFLVENLDELIADNLAFFFRVGDAAERGKEPFSRVHANNVDTQVLGERRHHLVRLVMPQQAVIDKYTGELVADRFMQQCRYNRGVDTTGQPEQHLAVAHGLPNGTNCIGNNVVRRPVAGTAQMSRTNRRMIA